MLRNSLWDVAIYTGKMNDYKPDIQNGLKQAIYKYDEQLKIEAKPSMDAGIGPWPQRHKVNLKESDHQLLEAEDQYIQAVKQYCGQSLANVLNQCVGKFHKTNSYNIAFEDSWYHITKDGGYHDIHNHGNASWCGIFYVDIGDAHMYNANGVNRFYRPMDIPVAVGLEHLGDHAFDVTPEDGKLVIFPGYLKHCAVPYFGTKDRIVISFNAFVEVPDDPKLVGRSNPEGEQE